MTSMWFPHVPLLYVSSYIKLVYLNYRLKQILKCVILAVFLKATFVVYEDLGLKNSGLNVIWTWTSGWTIRPTGSWLLCMWVVALLEQWLRPLGFEKKNIFDLLNASTQYPLPSACLGDLLTTSRSQSLATPRMRGYDLVKTNSWRRRGKEEERR